MPDFSGSTEEWLAAIAGSGTATVSAVGFVLSQIFLAVGFVGVAHLLRARTPVLAPLAGALLVLSCFGHAVWGGVNLLMLPMSADPANYAAYAQLLDRAQSSGAVFPFMALGTLAMVIGYVLLGVALIRSKFGPLWLGIALIAWVPLEFAGSASELPQRLLVGQG